MFLLLSFVFFATLAIGRFLERFKVPWIFAALFLGFTFSFFGLFPETANNESFTFLANLGMYFLLFIIGFEIDLKELTSKTRFMLGATFFIIFFEALFGSLLVRYMFAAPWPIAILVALSFATVGEAVLLPILEEFNALNTKLGNMIVGIGLFDDVIEILALVMAVAFAGAYASNSVATHFNAFIAIVSLSILFLLTIILRSLKEESAKFSFKRIETLFLFILAIFFFFIAIGTYGDASALAAFLAGIALKTFIPQKRLEVIEGEVKTLCYGFFAPIFLLRVGMLTDASFLLSNPFVVLAIVAVSAGTKLLASIIYSSRNLGFKNSILLGIGLSVRFSTSIVIIKLLYDYGLITQELFSAVVASSAVFTLAIPVIFSFMLSKFGREILK